MTRWWFALYSIFLFLVLEFMHHFTRFHFPVCSIDYTIFDMLRCRFDSLYDQFSEFRITLPPFIFAHFRWCVRFFPSYSSSSFSLVCFCFSSSQDLESWRKRTSRTCLCTQHTTHTHVCICVRVRDRSENILCMQRCMKELKLINIV